MDKSNKFKAQVLYEQKKKSDLSDKIQKVQKSFDLLDKGIISPDKFISSLKNDFGEQVNERFISVIKNQSHDKINFRSILKHLEIIKDNNTEYRQASGKISNSDYANMDNKKARNEFGKCKLLNKILFIILLY